MTISTQRRTIEAIDAGNAGMAQVTANNHGWHSSAFDAIVAIPPTSEGTFEFFRTKVTPQVGEPGHPNAWGALANSLKKNGFLADTGRRAHMIEKRSHGRLTPVLQRTWKGA